MLADLGAEVVLVEPRAGSSARQRAPFYQGESLYLATHNSGKLSLQCDIDSESGKAQFIQLISATDIFIETTKPGTLETLGLGRDTLHQHNPRLVMLSISDFGQTGPYRDFTATNNVNVAMAGVLCRSGLAGREPLLPPGELALESSAAQAAWVAMVSYWQQQMIGVGDHIDFSLFESTAQILDPIMGVTVSAAAGKSAVQLVSRSGRPPAGMIYPFIACADGYVHVCILNPRQWQGMSSWLGDDHPYTDPSYGNLIKRMQSIPEILKLIGDKFKTLKAQDVVVEAQQRGIPCAMVASPADAMADADFNARQAWRHIELGDSNGATSKGVMPAASLEINGQRSGTNRRAPTPGEHTASVLQRWTTREHTDSYRKGSKHRPLAGIRVLDLGVIVAGAELGRVLSDQGAEVIKIESQKFPDGGRQSGTKDLVSISFSQGHRGKESLGINLRSAKGIDLFKQLAAKRDIVLSNFKPGTMESLGIGYEALRAVNPRVIMSDSSALGNSGPLSRSMGYGPLVRASTGLAGLWRYPDDDASFSDSITILPDHLAARVSAIGVMAMLVQRQKTGQGGTLSLSQAECVLNLLSTEFLRESLESGSLKAKGNHSEYQIPDGVKDKSVFKAKNTCKNSATISLWCSSVYRDRPASPVGIHRSCGTRQNFWLLIADNHRG